MFWHVWWDMCYNIGPIITLVGVKVDCSKIKGMKDGVVPTTMTELGRFLGLTGYHCNFVHDYRLIARPLTNLLKKLRFVWDNKAEEAFLKMKTVMATTPTLALLDISQPFVIEADASGDGTGVVLSQNNQAIAYEYVTWHDNKNLWSTYA